MWGKIFFKEFIELQRGFDLPEQARQEGKFPVIASTDIVGYHNEFKVLPPCVVTGQSGSLGFVQFIEKPCFPLNTTLFVKDFKGNHPRYVYYFLKTLKLEQYNSGVGVPTLNRNDLDKIEIKLPPLPIQRRIAEVLGRYDALIENYQRQIGLLEAMAREIYQEWFVRGRYPYAQAKADRLPVEWERKKVEDCFEILGGGTPSTDEPSYWENGAINWFTPTDITASQGIFLKESSERISESGYKNSSARLFPAYSVMMTSRATIGAVAINTEPATTNQGFITCLANKRFSHAFIYFWILHNKHIFELLANGATFLEITKGIFKEIEITVPPNEVLHNFDAIALPIFSKIENLQAQMSQLRRIRDKLLPRLMSGQLEVAGQTTP